MNLCSIWSANVVRYSAANHTACLHNHLVELFLVHLLLALETQDSKVVFCNTPDTFYGIEWRWMAWHKRGDEVSTKKLSVLLSSVCSCIVHYKHGPFATYIFALDMFDYLLDKGLELALVRGLALHEYWLVKALTNSPVNRSKVQMVIDVDLHRLIFQTPCLLLTLRPCSEAWLIHINNGMVVGNDVSQEHCELLPMFISASSVFQCITVDDLCWSIANTFR